MHDVNAANHSGDPVSQFSVGFEASCNFIDGIFVAQLGLEVVSVGSICAELYVGISHLSGLFL